MSRQERLLVLICRLLIAALPFQVRQQWEEQLDQAAAPNGGPPEIERYRQ